MANTKPEKSGFGDYLKGARAELRKIIWPNKEETGRYTFVVITISLIVALIVYLLDLIFANLLNLIV